VINVEFYAKHQKKIDSFDTRESLRRSFQSVWHRFSRDRNNPFWLLSADGHVTVYLFTDGESVPLVGLVTFCVVQVPSVSSRGCIKNVGCHLLAHLSYGRTDGRRRWHYLRGR